MMTEIQSKAFQKFTRDVRAAREAFTGGGLDSLRWMEFYEAKQAAYAELIEVAPAIKDIDSFWRMVQSTPSGFWLESVTAALKALEKSRKCADCESKILNGSRCESCATAKKEADKAKRKAGRKLKRRVKQLAKK